MKIIRPTTITESMIERKELNIYDGVSPTTGLYSQWVSSTTYGSGQVIIDRINNNPDGNRVYESAQGGNQGNDPQTDDGTWWTYKYSLPAPHSTTSTYNIGDVCYDIDSQQYDSEYTSQLNNKYTIYESVQDNNVNHDPYTDTTEVWWRPVAEGVEEYKTATTYKLGELVFNRSDFGIYRCVVDNALNEDPTSSGFWQRLEATDIYKLRDQVLGSSGTVSRLHKIIFSFTPTETINSIALLNVSGNEANVKMENTSFNVTKSMTALASGDSDIVSDWYSYFFSETRVIKNLVFFSVPNRLEKVTITITAGNSVNAEAGEIVIGRKEELGVTQYAPEFSLIDYSRKEVDQYGNYTITERAFSKRVNVRTVVPNYRISPLADLLTEIRATPVVWIPTEVDIYDESMIIYGFYKDFRMVVPHAKWAEMDLQIEGLT